MVLGKEKDRKLYKGMRHRIGKAYIHGRVNYIRRGNKVEMVNTIEVTNGKKVAGAIRFLRDGFLEARGISKNDARIKDILEVRKIEK